MRVAMAVGLMAGLALAGCSQDEVRASGRVITAAGALSAQVTDADDEYGTVAVWRVAPRSKLSSSSHSVTALVSRLDCAGGKTGRPSAPSLRVTDSRIVVTFHTPALPSGDFYYTCEGNKEVAYEIRLPEPLGQRALFDGQCLSGAPAMGTSFCDPSGRRYRPQS